MKKKAEKKLRKNRKQSEMKTSNCNPANETGKFDQNKPTRKRNEEWTGPVATGGG